MKSNWKWTIKWWEKPKRAFCKFTKQDYWKNCSITTRELRKHEASKNQFISRMIAGKIVIYFCVLTYFGLILEFLQFNILLHPFRPFEYSDELQNRVFILSQCNLEFVCLNKFFLVCKVRFSLRITTQSNIILLHLSFV